METELENPKIILMADNLKPFLEERREFLEEAGYTVIAAFNPVDADRILARGGIDLAIMDIRMVDDDDQEDTSGLDLARKYGADLPVIMLTGFPTWENVKASLGQDLNGLSPAVDFLAKTEPPSLMVQAVNLTLEHPRLKQNLIDDFEAGTMQGLYDAFKQKGPLESVDVFQKSLERTEKDMLQYRKMLSQQAQASQRVALWTGMVGFGIVLVGVVLLFAKAIPAASVSLVASVILDGFCVMFIRRATQSSRMVEKSYNKLQEIYKASQLISICDTIDAKTKREDAKLMILEKLAEKWFSLQGAPA